MTLHTCPLCQRPTPVDGWCQRCLQALRDTPHVPPPARVHRSGARPIAGRAADITLAAVALLEAARPLARVLPCSAVRKADLERLAAAVERMDGMLGQREDMPPCGCRRDQWCPQCDPFADPDYDPEAVPR